MRPCIIVGVNCKVGITISRVSESMREKIRSILGVPPVAQVDAIQGTAVPSIKPLPDIIDTLPDEHTFAAEPASDLEASACVMTANAPVVVTALEGQSDLLEDEPEVWTDHQSDLEAQEERSEPMHDGEESTGQPHADEAEDWELEEILPAGALPLQEGTLGEAGRALGEQNFSLAGIEHSESPGETFLDWLPEFSSHEISSGQFRDDMDNDIVCRRRHICSGLELSEMGALSGRAAPSLKRTLDFSFLRDLSEFDAQVASRFGEQVDRACLELNARLRDIQHHEAEVSSSLRSLQIAAQSQDQRGHAQGDAMCWEMPDVVAWRRAVDVVCLCPPTGKAIAEEMADLKELLAEDEAGAPRFALVAHGSQHVLVTAPHCVPLLRDGHEPHLCEKYTAEIARAVAMELQGACLKWSSAEQRRSEFLWCLEKRQGSRNGALLDPRNRDPNFLASSELELNLWFQEMRNCSDCWRAMRACSDDAVVAPVASAGLLHVDIHGCRDPPSTPSHMTIGIGAMLRRAESSPTAISSHIVRAFGDLLESKIVEILASLQLAKAAPLVRVVGTESITRDHVSFSGAWSVESQRLTQSQQAVLHAGFGFSVQLEMSKTLRRALVQQRPEGKEQGPIPLICKAISSAWTEAVSWGHDPPDAILDD